MRVWAWVVGLLALAGQGEVWSERRGDFTTRVTSLLNLESPNLQLGRNLKLNEGLFTETRQGHRKVSIASLYNRPNDEAGGEANPKLIVVKPGTGLNFRSAFMPNGHVGRSLLSFLTRRGYTVLGIGSPEEQWKPDTLPSDLAKQFGLAAALEADLEVLRLLANAGLLRSGYEALGIGSGATQMLQLGALPAATLRPSKIYLLDPMPIVHEIDTYRHRVATQAHAHYQKLLREADSTTVSWLGEERSAYVRQQQSPGGMSPTGRSNREAFLQQLGKGPVHDRFPLYENYFAVSDDQGTPSLEYTSYILLSQIFDTVGSSLVAIKKLMDLYAVAAHIPAAKGGYDLPLRNVTQPVHILSAGKGHGLPELIAPSVKGPVHERVVPGLGHMDLLYGHLYWPILFDPGAKAQVGPIPHP